MPHSEYWHLSVHHYSIAFNYLQFLKSVSAVGTDSKIYSNKKYLNLLHVLESITKIVTRFSWIQNSWHNFPKSVSRQLHLYSQGTPISVLITAKLHCLLSLFDFSTYMCAICPETCHPPPKPSTSQLIFSSYSTLHPTSLIYSTSSKHPSWQVATFFWYMLCLKVQSPPKQHIPPHTSTRVTASKLGIQIHCWLGYVISWLLVNICWLITQQWGYMGFGKLGHCTIWESESGDSGCNPILGVVIAVTDTCFGGYVSHWHQYWRL